jgi:hypothetical protein
MKGLLFFSSLLCSCFLYSQQISDTYSSMMSGAQLNHYSVLSLFYNPALPSQATKCEIGIGHTLYYPKSGIYDLQFAVSMNTKRGTMGVGVHQTGFEQFNETSGVLHYAIELDSSWSIGVTTGLTLSNFYLQERYLPNLSVGLCKQLNEQVKLSLGVFSQQFYTLNENLKRVLYTQWKLGFSYHSLNKQFEAYTSCQYADKLVVALCLYYRITEQIHFFVSGRSRPVDYSFGARVKLSGLAVLVGFQYNPSLGFSPSSVAEYAF